MKKIGLALSGGGFRASLYHLGLVRFLRDAGLLSQVSHITAVSGGSIIAAHLALNWDRYNGSPSEFDAAATELLAFVRLDVRNRIVRRHLLNMPLRLPRRLLGRSNRRWTRTGLLQHHYERFLFGDTSLFELPERPQLHLLATNLSEGCLCSFTRDGLLMVRRQPGHTFRIDRIHIGLATVATAVTASSAFPGFFPPLELTGAEVGANVGEFGRQAYTDGGVFDNLGVRMFRCLERQLLAASPLSRDDFFNLQVIVKALQEASNGSAETPLRRLAQVLVASSRPGPPLLPGGGAASGTALLLAAGQAGSGTALLSAAGQAGSLPPPQSAPGVSQGDSEEFLMSRLRDVMGHYPFHSDPLFAGLKPVAADAELLLQASRHGSRILDASDQLWLNRHLLEAAFREATGQPCFRRLNTGLDGVLVSDVGKVFEVQSNRRAGGLSRTATRATDIVMDRVWQLEMDIFRDTPGFVFAPITEVVEPAQDPTALHPEIQRQTANIRTDLDRFSLLEISSLVRHGYCVGRQTCRTRPDLFGAELPSNPPWDPIAGERGAAPPPPSGMRLDGPAREPVATTREARTLQASGIRRIWSTFLDYRDWVSYVYMPLIIPILFLLPYFVIKSYQHSHRVSSLIDSLSQGSRDLEKMSQLLDGSPSPWPGERAEDVRKLDEPDFKGFEIFQDSRIFDLRNWKPARSAGVEPSSRVYAYRRLKVLKRPENFDKNIFHFYLLARSPKTAVHFPAQQLRPRLLTSPVAASAPGQKEYHWVARYDFEKVPAEDFVDLIVEDHDPGLYLQRGANGSGLSFNIFAETAELTMWLLMPEGREYRNFRIVRHKRGDPKTAEAVRVVTEYLATDYTIIAFKLLSLRPGYTYEVSWIYK